MLVAKSKVHFFRDSNPLMDHDWLSSRYYGYHYQWIPWIIIHWWIIGVTICLLMSTNISGSAFYPREIHHSTQDLPRWNAGSRLKPLPSRRQGVTDRSTAQVIPSTKQQGGSHENILKTWVCIWIYHGNEWTIVLILYFSWIMYDYFCKGLHHFNNSSLRPSANFIIQSNIQMGIYHFMVPMNHQP